MVLALPLALASCSYFNQLFPQKHAHYTAPKPQYQATNFVQYLSLARLALANENADMSAIGPDIDVLQDYTAKPARHAKPYKDNVRVSVVMLECKSKTDGMLRLAAPYDDKNQDALLELLTRMNADACPLYNLWPATVTVSRGAPLDFNNSRPQEVADVVRARLDAMTHGAEKMTPLADARAQMALARLFIDNRQRDAAYLAIENAKHMLAAAENNPNNKEAIPPLLKELESLEDELHQAMPFTL